MDAHRQHRPARTPKQRLALRTTWAGCAIYGCGRGWKHLNPHHVSPWQLGGTTDLDNVVKRQYVPLRCAPPSGNT